jgi:hypothetical protein
MPLVRTASGDTALSNASGPSTTPPVIWPRSAILHRAAASTVEWVFGFTVSTAERIATVGSQCRALRQIDSVLYDVTFLFQVWKHSLYASSQEWATVAKHRCPARRQVADSRTVVHREVAVLRVRLSASPTRLPRSATRSLLVQAWRLATCQDRYRAHP